MSTNPRLGIADGLVRLRATGAEASIDVERGGRLASLRVLGRELLLGPPSPIDASIRWGSFLMAPWAGRLANGRFAWRGQVHQLRRNRGRHAIHGLVFDAGWAIERASESTAELAVELGPLGWPFRGRVRQRIALSSDGLTVTAAIEADEAMPAALGWHPWLDRGGADPAVRIDAAEVLVTRDMIPTGGHLAVGGRTDLRPGPRLGSRRLDHVYIGAASPVEITWPDLDLRLEFGREITAVVVHTPPVGFCIEPQTARPNAFSHELDRGGSLAASLTWRWSRTREPRTGERQLEGDPDP